MDTINTIITNARTLSNAPIDWSPTAGPIWLVGMMAGMAVLVVCAWVSEVRRERAQVRQDLYEQARVRALIRRNRMERHGYEEIM